MGSFFIFLAIVAFIAVAVVSVLRSRHDAQLEAAIVRAREAGNHTEDELQAHRESNAFWAPQRTGVVIVGVALVFLGLGMFNKLFFYAEPGYVYHVRTLFPAQERVIDDVGYTYYGMGHYNSWKKAMTVQAVAGGNENKDMSAESEGGVYTSASLPPLNIMFLDQVDANAYATARFRIPTDRETFLNLAHEYRTPENLLRTALIPAFKETLHATGSLMSAEEYYAGGRTEFNNEFELQMQEGIYIVQRKEVTIKDESAVVNASANASKGTKQDKFGNKTKVVFRVEKQYDKSGHVERKPQAFLNFGVQVVEAHVTDMKPNTRFVKRMELKQKASADRAIAREQRIQEEEQKLLAVAKGEREVAEKQASAKVTQIEKTTNAETDKQLALTAATKLKEQAQIDKETAEIILKRDKIKAQSVKVLADADAYKKRKLILADNALQMKLTALVQMNKDMADALSKRNVPGTVVYQGNTGAGGLGTDNDIRTVAQTQMLKNLKALDLDMDVKMKK